MKRKYKIRLTQECQSKLAFVKKVKEFSGLGLKESKEFVDALCLRFEADLEFDDAYQKERMTIQQFGEELDDMGIYIKYSGDKQETRRKAFFELGICDEDEILDNATKYLTHTLLTYRVNPRRTYSWEYDSQKEYELEDLKYTAIMDHITSDKYKETIKKEMRNLLSALSPELLEKLNRELIKL